MSFFSSIGGLFSNVGSKISGVVAKATPFINNLSKGIQKVSSTYTKVVAPIADVFAPGLASTVSSIQDAIGNKVFGQADDYNTPGSDYGSEITAAASVALNEPASVGRAYLGGSEVAMAASNAVAQSNDANAQRAVVSQTSQGGSGFFGKLAQLTGIGDGKPGVFGIGTGKNAARRQAEDAALGEGLSPARVKLAGQQAANSVPNRLPTRASSSDNSDSGSGSGLGIAVAVGIILKLLF